MKNVEINTTDWQGLSKKERRRWKKEQKRQKRAGEIKRKRLVKWGFFLGVIIFLAGGLFLFKYAKTRRYENAPKIQTNPATHNFGEISASQGVVEAVFEARNVGASKLTITGMETSCGCTTAKLKMEGEESPEFGMHGNPTDWSTSLEPGAAAELLVVFDPNFHQDAFGLVTRTVSVFSNDPWKSEEKVTIYADVKR